MVVARKVRGMADLAITEEIEKDLTKVIEAFDRAVNVGAPNNSQRLVSTMVHSQLLHVEHELLPWRLNSVNTTYHQDFGCMDGTRPANFLLE